MTDARLQNPPAHFPGISPEMAALMREVATIGTEIEHLSAAQQKQWEKLDALLCDDRGERLAVLETQMEERTAEGQGRLPLWVKVALVLLPILGTSGGAVAGLIGGG